MNKNTTTFTLTLAASLALSACGGDSSDTEAPATPAALTVTGTAATGAAMAGANVQIKCAGTSTVGTATSAANGSFSASITGATLPCALAATSSDGKTVLRSVAPAGTATSATANITPLSEIIVAQLAGGDAATLFTTFDASAQGKLTSANVSSAVSTVATALKGTIDLSGVNPLSDALVAASSGKTGNTLDQKLDSLGAALKAGGSTVADVAAALVANPGAPAVVQTLLQPAAASCAALRSGKFHRLDPYAGDAVALATVDAAALTVKEADGTVHTLEPVSGSACAYTADAGKTSGYVAKSGVILVRYTDANNATRAALLVPDQTVPLSELAATWNIAIYGVDEVGGPAAPYFSTQTLNDKSLSTAGADCVGLDACVSWIPRATDIFTIDATNGGYTQAADDEGSARLFPVKTAAGQIALFGVLFDTAKHAKAIVFFSKQVALTLPTAGQVDNFWDMQINSAGVAQTVSDTQTTIKDVDSTAGTYTRTRASDGRVDGFTLNKPRNGMRYRAAGSSQGTNGKTINFSASLNTPLPGMGITVYSSLTTDAQSNFFGFSIGKP